MHLDFGGKLPVEHIDVLYVSKQGTHLLWSYGKVAHIDDVNQIVLGKQEQEVMLKNLYLMTF